MTHQWFLCCFVRSFCLKQLFFNCTNVAISVELHFLLDKSVTHSLNTYYIYFNRFDNLFTPVSQSSATCWICFWVFFFALIIFFFIFILAKDYICIFFFPILDVTYHCPTSAPLFYSILIEVIHVCVCMCIAVGMAKVEEKLKAGRMKRQEGSGFSEEPQRRSSSSQSSKKEPALSSSGKRLISLFNLCNVVCCIVRQRPIVLKD